MSIAIPCVPIELQPLSESSAALFQQLSSAIPADTKVLLSTLSEDTPEEFVMQMRIILRRLMVVEHRAHSNFSELLRSLSDAIAKREQHLARMGEHKHMVADTIQWLLSVQGGYSHSAKDTSTRWYCCTLSVALLQSALAMNLDLPKRIQIELNEYFMFQVNDRSADVRLAALDGLAIMSPCIAVPSAIERAVHDCDSSARAVAVQLLVKSSQEIPKRVVERVSLDRASRVRRIFLETIEQKAVEATQGKEEWIRSCSWIVLRGLRDRSPGVRAVVVRYLLACTKHGWSQVLQSDLSLCECVVLRLSKILAGLLKGHSSRNLLIRQLSPQYAISKLYGRKRKAGDAVQDREQLVASLFARIATTTVACTIPNAEELSLPVADMLVPILLEALDEGSSFELRQILHTMLFAELPESKTALAELAYAAAAVLQRSPVTDARMQLQIGVFPMSRLGSWAENSPSLLDLGMSLLRKVTSQIAGSDSSTRAEAWFSRAASAALKNLRQMLATMQANVLSLENELNAGFIELERSRQNLQKEPSSRPSFTELDRRLAEAREACSEQHLRTMLCAIAWLQQCQAPLASDALQRATLQGLFRPTLDSSDAGEMAHVAAILGIATYATKSKDQALAHWPFFVNLLKPQLLRIEESLIAGSSELEKLCVAARLIEITLLFLSDVLLLYVEDIDKKWIAQVFELFASTLQTLDNIRKRNEGCFPSPLSHLHALLCDRSCCLAVMGRVSVGGSAALWVLGYLLADACGAYSFVPSTPRTQDSGASANTYTALSFTHELNSLDQHARTSQAELQAVSRGRLLRFFAGLPVLSLPHAELLVRAVEAFFAIRFWVSSCESPENDEETVTSLRRIVSCVVRAARLACSQLMQLPSNMGPVALQMRVIRAIAAAFLISPAIHSTALQEALAVAVLSSVRSGSVSQWAGDSSAGQPRFIEVLSILLHDWVPSSSAKDHDRLLAELRAEPKTDLMDHVAWTWAQDAMDSAADLRHDLVMLGMLGPKQHDKCIKYNESRVRQQARAPCEHEELAKQQHDKCMKYNESRVRQQARVPCEHEELASMPGASSDHLKLTRAKVRWCLVNGAGEQTELVLSKNITLGRNSGCDIVIPAAEVSGKHCSVLLTEECVGLKDLGGRNGTFKNGSLVGQSCCVNLEEGDIFTLASPTGLQFSLQQINTCKQEADLVRCSNPEGAQLLASLKPPTSPPLLTAARPSKRRCIEQGIDNSDPRLVDISLRMAHRLPCDGIFTIGRRSDCECTIDSAEISGRHCIFFCQDGRVEVVDVSTNGVYINEKRLCDKGAADSNESQQARQHLHHGDRIALARRDGPELLFCAKGHPWRALLHEGGS